MTTQQDEAVCIRHWDFSETSQTVGLFTRGCGVVRAIAKGSRRERGGFSGGIDLLTRADTTMILNETSDLATLTEWALIENFPNIRANSQANKTAYFAADIVGRFFGSRDPHPNMYDGFVHLLTTLGESGCGQTPTNSYQPALLEFQWLILKEAGYQPQLELEQGDIEVVHFDPRDGGRVTESGTETSWRVRRPTITLLARVRDQHEATFADTDAESVGRANRLLAAYIREIVGEEPPAMRSLFGELIARG